MCEHVPTFVGIIADDLTGANATGIQLKRYHFRTASLTSLKWPVVDLAGYDCVCVNTESRALPPAKAYERVQIAARLILEHGGQPMAKRIDSTLRGNLGAELEAVLDVLGPGSIAVVTGAFPASGRTTVDGYHYVNGVPVAETAVRYDPLCPVTESHVPTLLAGQTRLPIGQLLLPVVRSGAEEVARVLRNLAGQGFRLVAADAETDADIHTLGIGMALSGLQCIAADPGPLTAAYVAAALARQRERVLVVCGSVTPTTRIQMDHLERNLGAVLVAADAAALAAGGDVARTEIGRVLNALAALPPKTTVIGVHTGEPLALSDHRQAETVAAGLAEIAAEALAHLPGIGGLYTTGGDVTLAVCRRLGVGAIDLVDEILPLAAAGRLLGGVRPGLPIVTKGGLVGGPDAATLCVRHLLKEVAVHD